MVEAISTWSPVAQAGLATLFTWGLTGLGAALVFFVREVRASLWDSSLGFAAGIMIAVSFWSLLAPAIAMAEAGGTPGWFPAAVGFLLGGAALWGVDKLLPHLHPRNERQDAEGPQSAWKSSTLLVLAITLHNIPEGLAVGVAFGALAGGTENHATLVGAAALALGIGIQNIPEGAAVSIPLRAGGMPVFKSFWYGQLSGAVEFIGGVAGALIVSQVSAILPYALAFAAGAMMFVVLEELIPAALRGGNTNRPTVGAMLGFTLMMVLDVALG